MTRVFDSATSEHYNDRPGNAQGLKFQTEGLDVLDDAATFE